MFRLFIYNDYLNERLLRFRKIIYEVNINRYSKTYVKSYYISDNSILVIFTKFFFNLRDFNERIFQLMNWCPIFLEAVLHFELLHINVIINYVLIFKRNLQTFLMGYI